MSESAICWYAPDGAEPSGPYTDAQLRALHAAGDLDNGGRVWTAQSGAWRPLADYLRRSASGRAAGVGSWVVLTIVTVAFWAVFAVLIDFVGIDGTDRIPPQDVWFVWPGVGAAGIVVTVIGAGAWLRLASLIQGAPERAGVIRIGATLLTLVGLLLGVQELRQSSFVARAAARTGSWTYQIRADPLRRRLTINGEVGPRFGIAVERGLAGLRDPVTVEIHSRGGLIREALRAATAIQARPGATVVVRRWCASACLVVLMSGEQRLSDYDGVLSFHATAPAAETQDRMLNWARAHEGAQADAYLRQRGVPAGVVDRTNRLGPARMNSITATGAVRMGILTGLLDMDRPISVAEARERMALKPSAPSPLD